MSSLSSIFGVTALVAAVILILKAVLSRSALAAQSDYSADARSENPGYAALDNRRIDTRLALVLLVAGSILALPEFIGVTLAPTTLVILASVLVLFVNAYSRYARQMRATQPGPGPERYSRDTVQPEKPSHEV